MPYEACDTKEESTEREEEMKLTKQDKLKKLIVKIRELGYHVEVPSSDKGTITIDELSDGVLKLRDELKESGFSLWMSKKAYIWEVIAFTEVLPRRIYTEAIDGDVKQALEVAIQRLLDKVYADNKNSQNLPL